MRKRLNPVPPAGFQNDPQPPELLPTKDPDTIVYEDTGMGAADRANTNAVIQTKVFMDLAQLINSQKYLGTGIPFAPNAKLTITVWNSVSNQALAFQLWYIEPATGNLKPVPSSGVPPEALAPMMSITSDNLPNYEVVNLPATGGIIVSFEARVAQSSTITYRGNTLVKAEVDNLGSFMGKNTTIPSTEIIAYNYADSQKDVSYPSTDAILVTPTIPNGANFNPNAVMTITCWNSVANQALKFQLWYVDPTGILKSLAISNLTGIASDRSAVTKTITLPSTGGTIVSFVARAVPAPVITIYRGQTLVKCEFDNNASGLSTDSTTLILVNNYVYTRHDVVYPSDEAIVNPVEGQGYRYVAVITNPAKGSDISISAPSNAIWSIISARLQLQTSSVAGARSFYFTVSQAGNIGWQSPLFPTISQSLTQRIVLSIGYPSPVDASYDAPPDNAIRGNLPALGAVANPFKLQSNTTMLDVNDQWSSLVFVEEWIQPIS